MFDEEKLWLVHAIYLSILEDKNRLVLKEVQHGIIIQGSRGVSTFRIVSLDAP